MNTATTKSILYTTLLKVKITLTTIITIIIYVYAFCNVAFLYCCCCLPFHIAAAAAYEYSPPFEGRDADSSSNSIFCVIVSDYFVAAAAVAVVGVF